MLQIKEEEKGQSPSEIDNHIRKSKDLLLYLTRKGRRKQVLLYRITPQRCHIIKVIIYRYRNKETIGYVEAFIHRNPKIFILFLFSRYLGFPLTIIHIMRGYLQGVCTISLERGWLLNKIYCEYNKR